MRKSFPIVTLMFFMMMCVPACAGVNDIVIKGGTEVLVRILERVKSNKVQTGQIIRFAVERAVVNDDGLTLIEGGAHAYGKVTKVAKAGFFGAGGKLGITIDSVEAYNGKIIHLSGKQDDDGDNVAGASIVGVVVTPLTLFFRGTNAVIEAGTVFSAYVAHNVTLEVVEDEPPADEQIQEAPPPAPQPAPAAPAKKKAARRKTTRKKK